MVTELTEDTFDSFIDSNKYVLIDCWAPWCGPCRRMGPIIEELAGELEGKVAVAKLDTDENPGVSLNFNIQSIPALLIFRNGKQAGTIIGYSAERTAEVLRQAILGN